MWTKRMDSKTLPHFTRTFTRLSELKDSVACSAGAACHSDSLKVDPVMEAMGLDAEFASGIHIYRRNKQTKSTMVPGFHVLENPSRAGLHEGIGQDTAQKTDTQAKRRTLLGRVCSFAVARSSLRDSIRTINIPQNINISAAHNDCVGTLRLSAVRYSTLEEMDVAAIAIVDAVQRLRRRSKAV